MNRIAFVMNRFVMNSIGMFDKFMNIYRLFINSYCPLQNINCRGANQLKFIFMNFIILVMNSLGLVMNNYELV